MRISAIGSNPSPMFIFRLTKERHSWQSRSSTLCSTAPPGSTHRPMRHEISLINFLAPVTDIRNNRLTVPYQICLSRECRMLNNSLRTRVLQLVERDITHMSHYLGGRYENLYVSL